MGANLIGEKSETLHGIVRPTVHMYYPLTTRLHHPHVTLQSTPPPASLTGIVETTWYSMDAMAVVGLRPVDNRPPIVGDIASSAPSICQSL